MVEQVVHIYIVDVTLDISQIDVTCLASKVVFALAIFGLFGSIFVF